MSILKSRIQEEFSRGKYEKTIKAASNKPKVLKGLLEIVQEKPEIITEISVDLQKYHSVLVEVSKVFGDELGADLIQKAKEAAAAKKAEEDAAAAKKAEEDAAAAKKAEEDAAAAKKAEEDAAAAKKAEEDAAAAKKAEEDAAAAKKAEEDAAVAKNAEEDAAAAKKAEEDAAAAKKAEEDAAAAKEAAVAKKAEEIDVTKDDAETALHAKFIIDQYTKIQDLVKTSDKTLESAKEICVETQKNSGILGASLGLNKAKKFAKDSLGKFVPGCKSEKNYKNFLENKLPAIEKDIVSDKEIANNKLLEVMEEYSYDKGEEVQFFKNSELCSEGSEFAATGACTEYLAGELSHN